MTTNRSRAKVESKSKRTDDSPREWNPVELSIRDAKARFTEAAAAAAGGERVIVTKHGRPFVELIPARRSSGMDFEKAAVVRHQLGLDGRKVVLPPDFDDPAFSRQVLGLEE